LNHFQNPEIRRMSALLGIPSTLGERYTDAVTRGLSIGLVIAITGSWLQAASASADVSVGPAISATVILLPVDPETVIPPLLHEPFYHSGWVMTDTATGTEEYRVSTTGAVPPGLRRVVLQFSRPAASVTVYFDVVTASEGSGLGPGDCLMALSLHSIIPSATAWQGNFIVREMQEPVVVQVRARIHGMDCYGLPLGRVNPSVTAFNSATRSGMITVQDDDRPVTTITTAAEHPSIVAGKSAEPEKLNPHLVPLWASSSNRLTSADAKRRQAKTQLACADGQPVACAASSMLVYLRAGMTVTAGEALCRERGWKPLHLFRRRGADNSMWYSVLLPEGQELCRQLDEAGHLPGVERATPVLM